MADDTAVAADVVVQEVKTKWEKVKGWFKDSLTIFWARIQWFLGTIGAGLVIAFSGYDFTQLASMDLRDVFKMLAVVAISGVLTELARRRTL